LCKFLLYLIGRPFEKYLSNQHSAFSTAFPIYIWNSVEEEVPEVDEEALLDNMEEKPLDADEDEAVVEEETEKEPASPKMKKVMVGQWEHLNSQPPLWMRCVVTLALARTPADFLASDPKTVSDEEYELLYQATFKDFQKPLAWHHFHGDSESGVSFRALIYVPSRL
jgi:heat shock protein beta